MAVQLASNIAPKNGQTYYMMEDIYLKGGLQIRDNIAARDSIAVSNLKIGSMVLTADDSKLWIVTELVQITPETPDVEEKATWEEMSLGGDGPKDDAPKDGKTYGRKDEAWVEVSGSGGFAPNSRVVVIHNEESLPVDSQKEFTLELAASTIILKLETSRPVKVLAYGTPAKDEDNPYEFVSTPDHLSDDGRQKFADGTIFRTRNYSIFANFEDPVTNNIYFTLESVDETEGPVTLTITHVVLEVTTPPEEPTDGSTDQPTDGGTTTPTP